MPALDRRRRRHASSLSRAGPRRRRRPVPRAAAHGATATDGSCARPPWRGRARRAAAADALRAVRAGRRPGRRRRSERRTYHDFVDYAVRAEALGFVSAFLTEHHFTGLGQASSPLTLLAHLAGPHEHAAARHRRHGAALAQPDLVAEQAATVDVLSRRAARLRRRPRLSRRRVRRLRAVDGRSRRALRGGARGDPRGLVEPAGAGRTTGASGTTATCSSSPRRCRRPTRRSGSAPAARRACAAAADRGFRLLLDQVASFELTGERIATYRERVAELGRPSRPRDDVAVTRSLLPRRRPARARRGDRATASRLSPRWRR